MRYLPQVALATVAVFILSASTASAHVVVKPDTVKTAARQIFVTGVPNEQDTGDVTEVRLTIPEGLKSVTPNVKPGWTITEKKTGSGEDTTVVTEITWSGGKIPVGQRDEFSFSAQAPTNETTLNWKAYQTYSDGTLVSWDQESGATPYSKTKVTKDDTTAVPSEESKTEETAPMWMATLALVISLLGVAMAARRR